MALRLRPTTMDDGYMLFLWRARDEETSPWYQGPSTQLSEHYAWLEVRLESPLVDMLTAEVDGELVGSARVDSNGEVTVTVHPLQRRKGYGTQILLAVMALSKVRLKASIDKQNLAAAVLAHKCGFEWLTEVDFYLWRP